MTKNAINTARARMPGWFAWVLWCIFYGAILAVFALPDGFATQVRFLGQPVSVLGARGDIVAAFGGAADIAVYANAGADIARTGWFVEPYQTQLWAPGLPLLHALMIVALGDDGPAVLGIVVVTAAVWGFVLGTLRVVAARSMPAWAATIMPTLFLLLPFFREYLLRDGTLSSESLSAAFWCLGFLLLFLSAARQGAYAAAIAGGLCFACAAYIRGQVDLLMLIGGCVIGADLALRLVYGTAAHRAPLASRLRSAVTTPEYRSLLVALMVFFIATLPYRAYKFRLDRSLMFTATNYYFKYMFLTPEEYPPAAGFILQGGGPVGCYVDPELCDRLKEQRAARGTDAFSYDFYKKLAVITFASRPVPWLRYRLEHLPRYWFSKPSSVFPEGHDPIAGYALATAFFASIVLALGLLRANFGKLLGFGLLSIYLGNMVVFLFIHFEVRYLYLLQFAAPLLCLLSWLAWLENRRSAGAGGPAP